MQNISLRRKLSIYTKWLIRGLLIVLILLFTGASIRYLAKNDFVSTFSKAIGFEPTPTPTLPAVVRIQNMILDENLHIIGTWMGDPITELIIESDALFHDAVVSGGGIEQVVTLIVTLNNLDLAVRQANIYNEQYSELILNDGMIVLYSTSNDPVTSAYKLQEMYAIFSIEGEVPEKIDLRFQKPAIIN